MFLAFSPGLPIFVNFRTKGFQSHHKEDCVFNAHAHVAVELSVLAIIHKACNSAGLKIVPLLASSTFSAPYFHYVIQTRTCIHS